MQGHRYFTPKKTRVTYCVACGHVPLNNGISRLVSRLGCDFDESPLYQQWVRSGRKPMGS